MFQKNYYQNVFKPTIIIFLSNIQTFNSSLISHSSSSNLTSPIDIISKKSQNLCPKTAQNSSYLSLYYENPGFFNASRVATYKNNEIEWENSDFQDIIKIDKNSFYFNYNSSSKVTQNPLKIACKIENIYKLDV